MYLYSFHCRSFYLRVLSGVQAMQSGAAVIKYRKSSGLPAAKRLWLSANQQYLCWGPLKADNQHAGKVGCNIIL